MTATFLVEMVVDDTAVTSLPELAGDIEDDLTSAGHNVVSVHPWARPTVPIVVTTTQQAIPATPPPTPFA